MEEAEYSRINDFYLPPRFLRLYDGPDANVEGAWRTMGRRVNKVKHHCLAADGTLQPILRLLPKPAHPSLAFWQGHPEGELLDQMSECLPEVVQEMAACIKKAGPSKSLTNVLAVDSQMLDRGKYILSQFAPVFKSYALLVRSYVEGGAVTDTQPQGGYTAFVHTKLSQVIGAPDIHAGVADVPDVQEWDSTQSTIHMQM